MRPIDADDFMERMECDTDLCAEMEQDGLKALKKYLDLQPTAYDVDKIVEQLEEERELAYADFDRYVEEVECATVNDHRQYQQYSTERSRVAVSKQSKTQDPRHNTDHHYVLNTVAA